MTKFFSVERDLDGNIKVIAGNTAKTYKDPRSQPYRFFSGCPST